VAITRSIVTDKFTKQASIPQPALPIIGSASRAKRKRDANGWRYSIWYTQARVYGIGKCARFVFEVSSFKKNQKCQKLSYSIPIHILTLVVVILISLMSATRSGISIRTC